MAKRIFWWYINLAETTHHHSERRKMSNVRFSVAMWHAWFKNNLICFDSEYSAEENFSAWSTETLTLKNSPQLLTKIIKTRKIPNITITHYNDLILYFLKELDVAFNIM